MKARSMKAFPIVLLAAVAATSAIPAVVLHAQQAQSPSQLNGDDVISHLNAVIGWYHDVTTNVPPTGVPIDAVYRANSESLAADAVRLAFESARQEAPLVLSPQKSASATTSGGASTAGSQSSFAGSPSQSVSQVQEQISALETQIAALNKEIAAAPTRNKQNLISQREALEGQRQLNKAVLDALQKVSDFAESAGGALAGGLLGNINRLGQSIPEVMGKTAQNAPAKQVSSAPTSITNPGGLYAQSLALYSAVRSLREIDLLINETGTVTAAAAQVRKPLRDALRAVAQQGGVSTSAGTTAPQPAPTTDFDALTQRFNDLSSAALPLSEEIALLDQSKTNLLEWRRTIVRESKTPVRALLFHLGVIAVALGLVLVLSDIWRRLTFRYVKDVRLRRQFLVLRKFVIGFLMGVVLILGFVSQFSSLATFAGFVAAGVAVGLQAVLLSVAAYFFLVGRWGIRVGDRVSVSGVTGDVIDVGLVRFYMMELAGTGIDFYPTGRIVVFANSVLFQPNTPLFKQIPGTEYALHEVAVALAAGANYKAVQDWLLNTVNSVYTRYRGEIERQHEGIEAQLDIRVTLPATEGRLQFTESGLEFAVRYPVEIGRAAEIDEEITRAVLETLDKDASLKTAVLGLPKIRTAVRG